MANGANRMTGHAELCGQRGPGDSTTLPAVGCANGAHVGLSQFSFGILCADVRTAFVRVVLRRQVFQILDSVVEVITVFVMNLMSGWPRPKKDRSNRVWTQWLDVRFGLVIV